MLELTRPDVTPAELPDLRLKVPVNEPPTIAPQVVDSPGFPGAEPMPLVALREAITDAERAFATMRNLTVQAESYGESLTARIERSEATCRRLEQENRELHERLLRLENRVPRWLRKVLGAS